ncbi:putative nucleotidyltransferase-like protein [Ilumatobacter fluminis]|uniref:Putative nucleotidyltransferase-like protein n=1 Tax=Ilumatobacter fluminis TaxID=467091 RepID=A0A4R7HY90_9ACTN|nr:nucleotidyltransferase family protein [Ilumatobacter fluminis]TDT15624.1 putative nucleotidyltransferase-like protein [Ilumatobacter fluminis]
MTRRGPLTLSGRELDLIRAAVAPPAEAGAAWSRWAAEQPPAAADWRSQQLLAYVVERLGPDVVDAPTRDWVKLQRRRIWADNQLDLAALGSAIDLLADLVSEPIVIKGAAMIDTVYPPGLRAMGDADLVVGPDAYEGAIERLLEAGWTAVDRVSDRHVSRAVALASPNGRSLDLHRWVLFPRSIRRPGVELIDRAVPDGPFGARRLDWADSIVLAALQGPDGGQASSLRWPIDVAVLARHAGGDVWDRVEQGAESLGVGRPVGESLDWLRRETGVGPEAERCARMCRQPYDRWLAAEWAWRRRGGSTDAKLRTYRDISRALDRRPTPVGYAAARWAVFRESGGAGPFLRRRWAQLNNTFRGD